MSNKKCVHLICNAHLDPVWLWQWQEGAAEAISTFRTAAELCEKDDAFIFNHNEVILYEWVREYEPSLFKRIQKLVKQGRWHIMGGWYLQPDCNMPSGESFVRQILAGRQYFKKYFGVAPKTAINFDPFGHSRGLVQIMAKSGFTSYLFGRPTYQFMDMKDEPFVWVGFDGSEIVAKRFCGWYNTSLGKARQQIEDRIAKSQQSVQEVLWGVGNHGGGPSRKDLVDVNAMIKDRKDISIQHSTPEKYFEQIAKQGMKLSRRANDLNPWAIGCYTSAIRIKQQHRKLENELYLTEKMLSAAAANKLTDYPQSELNEAVNDLLYGEFHDILPGSSIQPVEQDALQMMNHGFEILSRLKARSFFALASGQKRAPEGTIPVLVYNPHPVSINQTVECEFNLADFVFDGSFFDIKMTCDGKPVPAQVEHEHSNLAIEWRKRVLFKASLAPGQMSRFECTPIYKPKPPTIRKSIKNGKFIFNNGTLSVVINARTGLVDKYSVDGVNYVKKGAFCPVVLRDTSDPWEIFATRFGKTVGTFKLLTRQAGTKFSGVTKAVLDSVRIVEDGEVRTVVEAVFGFEESFICQRYKLPKFGTEMEVETRVFWNQKDQMLKLAVPLTYAGEQYLGQTAFGTQELPNDGNEAVAQKWVAAVNKKENKCLTCINDGIYGSDLQADVLRLSLLRSPAYSGHPNEDMKYIQQDRFTPRIDQGERLFTFWFNAGKIQQRLNKVSNEALIKNEKPMALSFFPNGGGSQPKPLASIDNQAIEMSAFKKAENGAGWIVRLFNSLANPQSAQFVAPVLGVRRKVKFGAFEVKTFRINNKAMMETNLIEQKL